MSCNIHFEPISTETFICGCGFRGKADDLVWRYTTVGSVKTEAKAWNIVDGKKIPMKDEVEPYIFVSGKEREFLDSLPEPKQVAKDRKPLLARKADEPCCSSVGALVNNNATGEEVTYVGFCPKCGARKEDSMLMFDIGRGSRSVPDGFWDEEKTRRKFKWIQMDIPEIRLDSDFRNIYPNGSKLFYEVLRYARTELDLPKKDPNLTEDEAAARSAAWKAAFNEEWTPKVLMRRIDAYLKMKNNSGTSAEELAMTVIFTLFGRLDELKAYLEIATGKYAYSDLAKIESLFKSDSNMDGLTRADLKEIRRWNAMMFLGKAWECRDQLVEALFYRDEPDPEIAKRVSDPAASLSGPYLKMASLICDYREHVAKVMINGGKDQVKVRPGKYLLRATARKSLMKRYTLEGAIKSAMKAKEPEVVRILTKLNDEFGKEWVIDKKTGKPVLVSIERPVAIRSTAIAAIRKNRYRMWAIRGATTRAFEKNTWKEKDFLVLHDKEFFSNPEFDVDRGAPVENEAGSFIYDPNKRVMEQIAGPWVDLWPLTKKKMKGGWKIYDFIPYSDNVVEDDDKVKEDEEEEIDLENEEDLMANSEEEEPETDLGELDEEVEAEEDVA